MIIILETNNQFLLFVNHPGPSESILKISSVYISQLDEVLLRTYEFSSSLLIEMQITWDKTGWKYFTFLLPFSEMMERG